MNLESKLAELVEKHLPDEKYYVTEIIAKPAGSKTKISIFLDGDDGITIDTCAEISRGVGKELEAMDIIGHPYTLMVSSPGLDQPLKLPRQYRKNLGRKLKIKLSNQEQIKGTLSEVQDDNIVIDAISGSLKSKNKRSIPFAAIETTHVLVSF